MRCRSCDCMMHGHAGWIVLEDGTRVEEEWCSECRTIAFDEGDVTNQEHILGVITSDIGSVIYKDGVTLPCNVPY